MSERTPQVRNVHISGITGTAHGAGLLFGLDESRLDDVTLTDIDVAAETGLVIGNADHVTLRSCGFQTERARHRRRQRGRPAPVRRRHAGAARRDAGQSSWCNVPHAFLQGCFAPVGSDSFLSVRGRDTRAIIVGENDLAGARTPVMLGGDVSPTVITRR